MGNFVKGGWFVAVVTTAVWAGPVLAAPPAPNVEKGKAIFTTNCVTCHGEKGDGNGPAGAMMNPKPRNLGTEKFKQGETREAVFKTLETGVAGTSMAGYGYLPAEERWALADFVLTFKKGAKTKSKK